MKDHEIHQSRVAYLDGELTDDQRAIIEQHVAECPICQYELARLQTIQNETRRTLHAVQVSPSPLAWDHLQARLMKEARPSRFRLFTHNRQGASIMKRMIFVSSVVAVVALLLAMFFVQQDTSSVSAQEILKQAAKQQPAEGIQHIRSENYNNGMKLNRDAQNTVNIMESHAFVESYLDPQAKKFRTVMTDADSGAVFYVSAFDGETTYSSEGESGSPLTVYQSSLGAQEVADSIPTTFKNTQELFEAAQNDPDVKLLGEETWLDGRKVYVLRSEEVFKLDAGEEPAGYTLMYFDVDTYKLLETQTFIVQDGKEEMDAYNRWWVDEILPSSTPIDWGLSDVEGITIIEDTTGEHVDQLPITVSAADVIASGGIVYLLNPVPDGFTEMIQATQPKPSSEEPVTYIITYSSEAGDYLVLQQSAAPDTLRDEADETYQTANGLTLSFMADESAGGKTFTAALVQTPDGSEWFLTSTLPRDQIKALADTLAQAK
ncbi:MAG TPA: zf-HC2 domain-containing protein [Aggregatilineaceae bacterium]|nr:zf-HC2 domain-containing protein [Aggregatilineaceae bacterium]